MDIRMHTIEMGTGTPLVLLHGNGEDSGYFKRQMEPFSQHYRVIAPDARGHGNTPRGDAPFTLEQFALDLKEFLDEQGIARCHMLGFSDGGNVALLFALRFPQYIRRMVLCGANLNPMGVKLSTQLPIMLQWCLYGWMGFFQKKAWRRWELLNLMVTQPHIRPKKLGQIAMPTLVVAGEGDMIRRSHTQRIADALPDSSLVILPGDHFVARRNWMAFNPVVLDFLGKE